MRSITARLRPSPMSSFALTIIYALLNISTESGGSVSASE